MLSKEEVTEQHQAFNAWWNTEGSIGPGEEVNSIDMEEWAKTRAKEAWMKAVYRVSEVYEKMSYMDYEEKEHH